MLQVDLLEPLLELRFRRALSQSVARPASTALPNAAAMRTGSDAIAIAVFTKTASAPSSIASAAWLGAPIPAWTTTGTVAWSMMIRVLITGLEPTIASDRRSLKALLKKYRLPATSWPKQGQR